MLSEDLDLFKQQQESEGRSGSWADYCPFFVGTHWEIRPTVARLVISSFDTALKREHRIQLVVMCGDKRLYCICCSNWS